MRVIQRRVQELRQDYDLFRREQQTDMADFSLCLRGTFHKIMAAIRSHARVAGKPLSHSNEATECISHIMHLLVHYIK